MDSILTAVKSLLGMSRWDYSDRRNLLRLSCKKEVQVQIGEDLMVAEVRDLSISGLQLLCFGAVKKDAIIKVKARDIGLSVEVDTITCRVHWRVKQGPQYLIGASFEEDERSMQKSWVFEELKLLSKKIAESTQKRESLRVACRVPAHLKAGNEVRKCILRDLGLQGARVECAGSPLEVNDEVALVIGPIEKKLPRLALVARVIQRRRRRVPQYGLLFTNFHQGGQKDLTRYMDFFFDSTQNAF